MEDAFGKLKYYDCNWVSGSQGREAFQFFFPMGGIAWRILGFLQIYSLFKHLVRIRYLKQLGLDIYSMKYWIADTWNPSHVVQTNKSYDTGALPLLAPTLLARLPEDGHLKSVFHDSSCRILKCTLGFPVKQALARVSSKQSKSPETSTCEKNQMNVLCLLKLWFCRMS